MEKQNNESCIYGVDINKEVTPLMVRDAIAECFFEAHCADTGIDGAEESTNKDYCRNVVKKIFKDAGGDYENPTKEDIMNALQGLADFSKNFRDQDMIKHHQMQIMKLVERLK